MSAHPVLCEWSIPFCPLKTPRRIVKGEAQSSNQYPGRKRLEAKDTCPSPVYRLSCRVKKEERVGRAEREKEERLKKDRQRGGVREQVDGRRRERETK